LRLRLGHLAMQWMILMTDAEEGQQKEESGEKKPREVIIVGAGSMGGLGSSLVRVLMRESAVEVPFLQGISLGHQGKGQRKANRKDRWR
jgi:hypothetical protein